ncbi:MAG: hypothetical protein GX964_05135 [Syntrophomonadaceae bacterium]|jgi:hypothetical protein|nr:hypothetical protein [Syntrophomonadaceae bacterium]
MFGIPRWNIAIIVLALFTMFGYSAYFDTPTPERTVEKFYTSFYSGDFEQAVDYLSVNMAYPLLFPRYMQTPPAELLQREDQIRNEMAQAFSEAIPENPGEIKVSIRSDYTKTGEKSAIVVYDYKVPEQDLKGNEVAILIKETGKWRLLEISDATGSDLSALKSFDMKKMDEQVEQLLNVS